MATRNLTKKFLEIRNAAKANRGLGLHNRDDTDEYSEDKSLKNEDGDSSNWQNVKNTLPPIWVERLESIEEQISSIQLKIGQIEDMHKKRLKVTFDTDESEQEQAIEFKTREITDGFHKAEKLLTKFGKESEDPSLSSAERTVRKNMQMSMARRLQTMSLTFRAKQKKYLESVNAQKNGGGSQFEFLNEDNKKSVNPAEYDRGFTQEQLILLEENDVEIEQRGQEIEKIAKSIEELAQIFRELAVLVIDQGTILDRIDYNMENAVEHAKQGIEHLRKAEDSQKNALSVKCIIVLVILIAMMVGILIWKHSK